MRAVQNVVIGASFASLALAHAHHQKRGTVPVDGTIWTACVTPGVVALTFDDGPFSYTQSIVDQLTAAGHRATFFQNGQNYDSIYNYNATLQSMIAGGHQVASHTWDHADLATLTAAQITNEMLQLEAAHLAIIGKAPTYMRPPYLSTNALVISTLVGLGYKIIEVDIDTQDWAEDPIGEVALSIQWYEGNQTAGGTISLNHDPYQPTADTFVPAIITYLAGKGLKSVPVGECMGDDAANWYRGGSAAPSASAPASGAPSASAVSNGTAPKPPSSAIGGGYGSKIASGLASPTGTGKPVRGGDTEPGHGTDAGHGAIPGNAGTGNTVYVAGANVSTSGSSSTNTSAAGAHPSYYTSSASALTGSIVLIGAAALALLL